MTVVIEVSRPWQWRPGLHVHATMVRVVWGFVAVGLLRIPFREFTESAWRWVS